MLRGEIIELHIRPAQQPSENEVADLLGVSRTPVREAFIRLAEDGLLAITPQKRSAITRLTEADGSALAAAIEAQQECLDSPAFHRMLMADNGFYRIILNRTRGATLRTRRRKPTDEEAAGACVNAPVGGSATSRRRKS